MLQEHQARPQSPKAPSRLNSSSTGIQEQNGQLLGMAIVEAGECVQHLESLTASVNSSVTVRGKKKQEPAIGGQLVCTLSYFKCLLYSHWGSYSRKRKEGTPSLMLGAQQNVPPQLPLGPSPVPLWHSCRTPRKPSTLSEWSSPSGNVSMKKAVSPSLSCPLLKSCYAVLTNQRGTS